MTGGRIVETVPETASNEQEIYFGDFDNDGDGTVGASDLLILLSN